MISSPNEGSDFDELRAVTFVDGSSPCGTDSAWAVGHYQVPNHPWRTLVEEYTTTANCRP